MYISELRSFEVGFDARFKTVYRWFATTNWSRHLEYGYNRCRSTARWVV